MSGRISSRDYERLCAYLDGQLPAHERGQMTRELQKRPDLHRELEALRRTRQVLRSVPMHKVPHNFILTRAMVATRKSPLVLPIFQFASALSTLAVVVLLVLDLSMGTLFQSASVANAPLAAVRSAAMAVTETPAPQIIEWNNTGSGGGSAAAAPLALGGGYGGGPSTAKSVMAGPTEAAGGPTEAAGVSTDMTQLVATPPAPPTGIPAHGETPAPTAVSSFSAQSENNGAANGPILGVPPAGQQGKIIVSPTPTPTSAPESVVATVFPIRRLLELALALLAVGMALAAWLVRRQR
ncbi:MAG: hypothetical protein ABSA51_02305 [Anaerolineaceae bacterium]|jgi:hypothetical protein